jgi:teichuronic acid biosynthesis glycosyltransferase TuaG
MKISVIIPAYQSENFLGYTIESALNQTLSILEVLVVDDGSTDSTREIVQLIANKDARVKYIYQDNQKQGAARNKGISLAQGDYIAFLDADDYWDKEFIQNSISWMIQKDADMIFSQMYVVDENNIIIGKKDWIKNKTYILNETRLKFGIGNIVPLSSVVCRISMLEILNGFDESYDLANAEDYELWIRILRNGYKMVSSEFCNAYYRVHQFNSTNLDNVASIPAARVILKHEDFFSGNPREWRLIRIRTISKILKFKKQGNQKERLHLINLILFNNKGKWSYLKSNIIIFLGYYFFNRFNRLFI